MGRASRYRIRHLVTGLAASCTLALLTNTSSADLPVVNTTADKDGFTHVITHGAIGAQGGTIDDFLIQSTTWANEYTLRHNHLAAGDTIELSVKLQHLPPGPHAENFPGTLSDDKLAISVDATGQAPGVYTLGPEFDSVSHQFVGHTDDYFLEIEYVVGAGSQITSFRIDTSGMHVVKTGFELPALSSGAVVLLGLLLAAAGRAAAQLRPV